MNWLKDASNHYSIRMEQTIEGEAYSHNLKNSTKFPPTPCQDVWQNKTHLREAKSKTVYNDITHAGIMMQGLPDRWMVGIIQKRSHQACILTEPLWENGNI